MNAKTKILAIVLSLVLSALASGCSLGQQVTEFVDFVRNYGDQTVEFVDNHGDDLIALGESFDEEVLGTAPVTTDLFDGQTKINGIVASETLTVTINGVDVNGWVIEPDDTVSATFTNGGSADFYLFEVSEAMTTTVTYYDETAVDGAILLLSESGEEWSAEVADTTIEKIETVLEPGWYLVTVGAGTPGDYYLVLAGEPVNGDTEPPVVLTCDWTVNPDQEPALLDSLELRADGSTWICSNDGTWVLYIPAPAEETESEPVTITPLAVLSYTIADTEVITGWTLNWTDVALMDRSDTEGSFHEFAHETWDWTAWFMSPELWPTPPNVPNPLFPDFRVVNVDQVPDGLEIPQGEANYCQVLQGEMCTNPVAALHYMLYTGDGEIPGLWKSVDGACNALSIWNVGNVTARFDGAFFQGWRNTGRYWNGDTLNIAMSALHSHTANVMHNMDSELNPMGIQNAGANGSVPSGCNEVFHTVIVTSGNEVLLIATIVTTAG